MTKEEIIRMARLYGTPVQEQNAEVEYRFTIEELGLLLSTACVIEREACAKVCDTWPLSAKNMLRMESWKGGKGNAVAGSIYECAAAIRARGETTSRGQA